MNEKHCHNDEFENQKGSQGGSGSVEAKEGEPVIGRSMVLILLTVT